jgi:hypothetical protein
MKHLHMVFAVVLLSALTACTTKGTGVGSSPTGNVSALIMWKSSSARSGAMTAMLSTGETFAGMYFQITGETRVDDLAPLRVGWVRPWAEWPYWEEPGPQFITYYSGRVVANLEGPNGSHMRCRFQLVRPEAGMAGGGQGQCQLPNGMIIDATFPPA